jgi:hypothetical protein
LFTKKMLAAAFAAVFGASSVSAASIVGFVVEGGGTQQVYALDNGNFLGLWGFDNREGANPGAGPVTIVSADDITAGFTAGAGSIVGYYNGATPINAGALEFDALTYSFTIEDNARLWDSVWVEWTGGLLTYQQPSNGTATMNSSNITRDGDPFAPAPVPLPAAGFLLLGALGGLGLAKRRKAA